MLDSFSSSLNISGRSFPAQDGIIGTYRVGTAGQSVALPSNTDQFVKREVALGAGLTVQLKLSDFSTPEDEGPTKNPDGEDVTFGKIYGLLFTIKSEVAAGFNVSIDGGKSLTRVGDCYYLATTGGVTAGVDDVFVSLTETGGVQDGVVTCMAFGRIYDNYFEFTVEVPGTNDTRILKVTGGSPDYNVDWEVGVSTPTNYDAAGEQSYKYVTAGTKTVRIWGDLGGGVLTFVGGVSATPLGAIITAVKPVNNLISTAGFVNFMKGCTQVTSLPLEMFAEHTELTGDAFEAAFNGCTALTDVPEDLFEYSVDVTGFTNTFNGCSSLASLPTDLFRYNVDVLSFHGTFSGTAVVAPDEFLFRYNILATTFDYVFSSCSSLTTLSENTFRYNTAMTSAVYTFSGCTGVTSLSANLFRYNILLASIYSTFQGCSGLTALPVDLLRYNTSISTVASAFYGCSGLTSLPTDLLRYNTAITLLNNMFYGCTGLTSLSATLFRYNTAIIQFPGTFYGCTGLTTLPTDLFRYNTAVTGFGSTFEGCSNLATLPANLFLYNVLATTYTGTFKGCVKLTMRIDLWGADMQAHFGSRSLQLAEFVRMQATFTGTPGVAPALWSLIAPVTIPTKTNAFATPTTTAYTNWASIPNDWKGL